MAALELCAIVAYVRAYVTTSNNEREGLCILGGRSFARLFAYFKERH